MRSELAQACLGMLQDGGCQGIHSHWYRPGQCDETARWTGHPCLQDMLGM